MEHLQFKLRIVLDFIQIKRDNIIVANSESGGVELKTRFFLSSNTDTNLTFGIYCSIQHIQFVNVIQYRDCVHITLIQHHRNVVDILLFFKTITENKILFIEHLLFLQHLNQVQVESRRGLNMHIILEHLRQHELEMGAFCAIAIMVICLIICLSDGHIKPPAGFLNVL